MSGERIWKEICICVDLYNGDELWHHPMQYDLEILLHKENKVDNQHKEFK